MGTPLMSPMPRRRTRRARTRTIAAMPTTISDRSDWTPERIDLLARALLPVAFPGRPGAVPRSGCHSRESRGCQVPAGGVRWLPQAGLTVMPPVWIITMGYVHWPRN